MMKPVTAYRHLLKIQAPSSTQDTHGQDVVTWSTVATVWGNIKPLSGRQLALGGASTIVSTATHEVRMRWRSGLLITYRLVFGNEVTDFDELTSEAFDQLTSAQFDALTSSYFAGSPLRTFSINAINDVEERRRELIITVTELKAA